MKGQRQGLRHVPISILSLLSPSRPSLQLPVLRPVPQSFSQSSTQFGWTALHTAIPNSPVSPLFRAFVRTFFPLPLPGLASRLCIFTARFRFQAEKHDLTKETSVPSRAIFFSPTSNSPSFPRSGLAPPPPPCPLSLLPPLLLSFRESDPRRMRLAPPFVPFSRNVLVLILTLPGFYRTSLGDFLFRGFLYFLSFPAGPVLLVP